MVCHFFRCEFFVAECANFCAFDYSQSRGINIPLENITNLYEGQDIKEKFSKRRGFANAYEEMQHFIREANKLSKRPIASKSKNEKKRDTSQIRVLRRSPRLNPQSTIDMLSGLRRSARLATSYLQQK